MAIYRNALNLFRYYTDNILSIFRTCQAYTNQIYQTYFNKFTFFYRNFNIFLFFFVEIFKIFDILKNISLLSYRTVKKC